MSIFNDHYIFKLCKIFLYLFLRHNMYVFFIGFTERFKKFHSTTSIRFARVYRFHHFMELHVRTQKEYETNKKECEMFCFIC